MEEKTNSIMPFYFPKDHKSIVSIIGIGGGAGRIVNKMQACIWYEQKRNGGTVITE